MKCDVLFPEKMKEKKDHFHQFSDEILIGSHFFRGNRIKEILFFVMKI